MVLLKAQLELFGLTAPVFSWIVSAALIIYSIRVYTAHLKVSRNRQQVLVIAEKRLLPLRDARSAPGQGLSNQAYRMLRSAFDDLPLLFPFWQSISSGVVVKAGNDGNDRIWTSETVSLDAQEMIDTQSYKSAPTIISSIGLLATFLAILVALLDVRLASNRVQGLDLLVQGLSGKFLSSVVALACATILISLEKRIHRPVSTAVASLEKTLRNILPRLTTAQVMVDLHQGIEEQSRLLKGLGDRLPADVKDGLNESMKPAMEQVATAMDLLAAKIEKRDDTAIQNDFSRLFTEFGQSLDSTLGRIADRFDNAAEGSAHSDFARISGSLDEVIRQMQGMNDRFAASQALFDDMISMARTTSAEEVASRQAQIEQLTEVVNNLMVKLQETTKESTGSMERALASIAFDMSSKVIDLSKQMGEALERSSERSADRTREVLDHAGSLSSQSAEQLARLLERHSAELTRIEDLRTMLDSTIKGFAGSIGKYGEVTEGLLKVTSQVNAGVASMGQVAKSIKDSQHAAVQVSQSVLGQIDSMKAFAGNQQETWSRIQATMKEYEKTFASVEDRAGTLLSEIARYLGGYSETTQKHFVELTSAADNFISRATGRLSASVDELSDQLDELQEVLSGVGKVSRLAS